MSLNVNKVALVRNSRGKDVPSLASVAALALQAGWGGLTIHPRADCRHARLEDIAALAKVIADSRSQAELNIECDLREEVIHAALQNKAHQITLVPVNAGELTTTRGWNAEEDDMSALRRVIAEIRPHIRVSMFIDPEREAVQLAYDTGAHAVELHTEAYATAFEQGEPEKVLPLYEEIAQAARGHGLRVNLGHGLNSQNLPRIVELLKPDEVSVGHAVIAEAIVAGLFAISPSYLALAD